MNWRQELSGLTAKRILAGVLTALVLLIGANWAAHQLRASEVYHRSRIISTIVAREEVDFIDMAGSRRNADMMFKFIGALTSAYIDFELIPLGEVDTFVAVFRSMPSGAAVEKFAYHRKNLTITGSVSEMEEYSRMIRALRATDYFESVTGVCSRADDGELHFELQCVARTVSVPFEFAS